MYVAIILTMVALMGLCIPVGKMCEYGKENGLYTDQTQQWVFSFSFNTRIKHILLCKDEIDSKGDNYDGSN